VAFLTHADKFSFYKVYSNIQNFMETILIVNED